MSTPRKLLTVVCVAIAFALLYPGVTQPVLSLSGTVEKSRIVGVGIDLVTEQGTQAQGRQALTMLAELFGLDQVEGELQVYQSTRSIWGTAEGLASNGYLAVALLIVLFSLVVPTLKLVLQAASALVSSEELRGVLLGLNAALSKWSMADVFLIGVLVAFMAGGAAEQSDELLQMRARLEPGFFYFLGYCVFSIAAGSFLLARN